MHQRYARTTLLSSSLLLLAPACAPNDESDSIELRAADMDVNMTLMEADGGDNDGTILWEIVEAEDGGDDDGTILWEIVEAEDGGDDDGTILWEILGPEYGGDADATIVWAGTSKTMCTVSGPYLSNAKGTVLMTVVDNELYAGEIPQKYITKDDPSGFAKNLRYTLRDAQVWMGPMKKQLVVADSPIDTASDLRKLTVGALVDDLCR